MALINNQLKDKLYRVSLGINLFMILFPILTDLIDKITKNYFAFYAIRYTYAHDGYNLLLLLISIICFIPTISWQRKYKLLLWVAFFIFQIWFLAKYKIYYFGI
jgi:hypothetical protein